MDEEKATGEEEESEEDEEESGEESDSEFEDPEGYVDNVSDEGKKTYDTRSAVDYGMFRDPCRVAR